MCVCVLEIHVLKILNWETILRDYCVDWIISWVVCWTAFMFVFFSSWKTVLKNWLDTSSTPPRYLAICQAFQAFFLTQSWHFFDTWWIDRESSCLFDSSSTPGGSIETLFLKLVLCYSILTRYLSCRWPLSRYLSCRALLKVLFKPPSQSFSHFFILSRSVRTCSSPKHSLSHFQPLPQVFFKLFQVFLHLVSV